jgi:hypothetical protein
MLFHAALVSMTPAVTLAGLAPVSAAIQKQVSRDFGPIWNVEATVDAFDKLEDVPVGYWHVLLQDELPNSAAGLHKRDDDKQPFALVALTTNWPVFMSHEVLEMLVDPQGTLTRAGNSLKPGQGRVEYLIEVCDPCQASKFAYTVNSVMVSDFYTPQYFDPVKSSGVRYSFSGQVGGPHEVLDGGYLSWFDPKTRHLFQLHVDGKKKTIVKQGEVPFGVESLRAFSDSVSTERRDAVIDGGSRAGMMLNSGTDYRKTARIREPNMTTVDNSQVSQARNLRAQLKRIAQQDEVLKKEKALN